MIGVVLRTQLICPQTRRNAKRANIVFTARVDWCNVIRETPIIALTFAFPLLTQHVQTREFITATLVGIDDYVIAI